MCRDIFDHIIKNILNIKYSNYCIFGICVIYHGSYIYLLTRKNIVLTLPIAFLRMLNVNIKFIFMRFRLKIRRNFTISLEEKLNYTLFSLLDFSILMNTRKIIAEFTVCILTE